MSRLPPPRISADDPRLLAFTPGPMAEKTAAEISAMREFYEARRILRSTALDLNLDEDRRVGERRCSNDRRQGWDRRAFQTMADKLAAAHKAHDDRRFRLDPRQHSAFIPLD